MRFKRSTENVKSHLNVFWLLAFEIDGREHLNCFVYIVFTNKKKRNAFISNFVTFTFAPYGNTCQ